MEPGTAGKVRVYSAFTNILEIVYKLKGENTMKYNQKKNIIDSIRESIVRRQSESFESFMQEKADVFQVTGVKEQAMFWAMNG